MGKQQLHKRGRALRHRRQPQTACVRCALSSARAVSPPHPSHPQVATWDDEEYLTDLGRRGVKATGLPWDGEADQIAMFDSVANGTFDALVLDSYVLEYGTNSRCDVTVVGDVFDQVGVGGRRQSDGVGC